VGYGLIKKTSAFPGKRPHDIALGDDPGKPARLIGDDDGADTAVLQKRAHFRHAVLGPRGYDVMTLTGQHDGDGHRQPPASVADIVETVWGRA
jgi:hypothetical protein